MRTRARILSQGDEIVSGATLDTNAHGLAGRLWARGVEVLGAASAPDDLEALVELIRGACRDADLVVSTGGLGPTSDDLSAEAAARAAGVELVLDAVALAQVRARFLRIQRPMTPSNEKQAWLPRGSTVLENTAGSAPGFALDVPRGAGREGGTARAFFFPGVPRELHVMVEAHLDPWLDARGLTPPLRARFHVCGIGESALGERLQGIALPPGVRLGYKAWTSSCSALVYGDAGAPGGEEAFERVRDEVRTRLAGDCFGEDDVTLPAAVGALLGGRGLSVAVAESCTAGLALAHLTEVAGSSLWVKGGVVAYGNDVKRALLGVKDSVLAGEGAVSEACASAMAEGVQRSTGAGVGLAITGIAGPGGGSAEKPVGLVCFGLSGLGPTAARTLRFGDRGRDVVRELAASHAIEWLRRRLAAGGRP